MALPTYLGNTCYSVHSLAQLILVIIIKYYSVFSSHSIQLTVSIINMAKVIFLMADYGHDPTGE
jgi:hypothetical protein